MRYVLLTTIALIAMCSTSFGIIRVREIKDNERTKPSNQCIEGTTSLNIDIVVPLPFHYYHFEYRQLSPYKWEYRQYYQHKHAPKHRHHKPQRHQKQQRHQRHQRHQRPQRHHHEMKNRC